MAVVRSGDEKAQLAAVKNPAFWRRLEVKDAAEFAGGDAERVAACLEATEDPQNLKKLARRFMNRVDPEIRLLAEGVVDGVFVPELVMIRENR